MGDELRFESSFLDDYFAEADEHLVSARRNLLALEGTLGGAASPAVLEELFRSFHSLKGISAMVELYEAEALAHHLEGCLRALRQGDATLTPVLFETLLSGVRALEQVTAARRSEAPLPAIDGAIAALQSAASEAASPERRADPSSRPARRNPGGPSPSGRLWKVTFVPSPELTARGVKVDSIRERLLQLGHVLAVAPRVLAGSGIAFEFDLQTEREDGLQAMRGDGVSYEPLDRSDPAIGEAPAASETATASRAWDIAVAVPSNVVRVDLSRLDDLMRLIGDLVVTRARLEDTLRRLEGSVAPRDFRALQEHDAQLERQLRDLREGIMRVRLVPVGEIFRRMPFVVRDLARDHGKRVRLEITGQGTEIDKFLIERMLDPVLHLVRNAVSHGIEAPEPRAAAGKPEEGTIRLAASTAGESVVVEIADDGRGIDTAKVVARARAAGLLADERPLDDRQLLDVLCTSGFSTRDEADRASGRGVGMAVVRGAVQELGGTLAVATEPGRGTTFTITLPLTLAITGAIVAHVGDRTFAVPQAGVREVIEVQRSDLRTIERHELATHRGHALPVVRLGGLFGIASPDRPRFHVIVSGVGTSTVGLLVDRISGQREIVVKTITDPLIRVEGVSGATELGDGRLVLILDVPALSRRLRDRPRLEERVST